MFSLDFVVRHTDADLDVLMQKVNTLQPQFLRVAVEWSNIESKQGRYNWTAVDRVVDRLTGPTQIEFQLLTVPVWNTSAPPRASVSVKRFSPPKDYVSWQRFCTDVVNRYPQVNYFEIWNEENTTPFWRGTATEYAKLLSFASASIRTANAQAQIILGGITKLNDGFYDALVANLNYPLYSSIDIVNFHSYSPYVNTFSSWYNQLRSGKNWQGPIWIGELGQSSATLGAAGQANWVSSTLPQIAAMGFEQLFWFELVDDLKLQPNFRSNGLLDITYQEKPSYAAYLSLTNSDQS